MGAALARTLAAAGATVTAWNRSPGFQAAGVAIAPTPAAAVEAADLILVCLRDHDIARSVLVDVATTAPVVDFTSATPDQARESATWAGDSGIERYLTAAIMVPVPMIGNADALILYSGPEAIFAEHADTLRILAGTADYLGADHGLAPLFDVAMLEVFFAGITSFIHAAAIAKNSGVSAQRFLPYARQIVSILPPTMEGLAADIDAGTFSGEEDRIEMDLAGIEHIVAAGHAAGLDTALAESMRDLGARAVAAGDGKLGWSKVFDHLAVGE